MFYTIRLTLKLTIPTFNDLDNWLVGCIGVEHHFNSQGHIRAVCDAHVFAGFLTPVQLPFQSHQLLFSHASEVRGKYARKKVCLNWVSNSQPPGYESDMLTTELRERGG